MKALLKDVAQYYSEKVSRYGATPEGVDWNSERGQIIRFEQLLRICSREAWFTLNDFGCGYGALLAYIRSSDYRATYCGLDISETMILQAQRIYDGAEHASFVTDIALMSRADYTVASGTFNVKLDTSSADWAAYIFETLGDLDALSAKAFAFNMLTSYSDADKMRPDLYYGDPCFFFDYCKRTYSRQVALLHDYGLYEFTILVRK